MIYVLILSGFEGIEDLIWAGDNKDEAIEKIKAKREVCNRLEIKKEELYKKHGIDDSDITSVEEKIDRQDKADEELDKFAIDKFGLDNAGHTLIFDADHYCIQGWNGESFKCVCNDLGVSPSKQMLR